MQIVEREAFESAQTECECCAQSAGSTWSILAVLCIVSDICSSVFVSLNAVTCFVWTVRGQHLELIAHARCQIVPQCAGLIASGGI